MDPDNKDNMKLNYSLLTKSEFDFLNNKRHKIISKNFEYKMRSNIKKKIGIFLEKELPLLVENNFIKIENENYNNSSNYLTNTINNDYNLVRKRSRVQIPLKAVILSMNFNVLVLHLG
ncbi:MAG: hypothetical protein R3321_06025 [Nitrososphaeraceae archaeon]|nr:hypothetical protein [Nitrososphaeraceae archaeon]